MRNTNNAYYAYDLKVTTDGGYVLTGSTQSTDGDVSSNHGGCDVWILKVSF